MTGSAAAPATDRRARVLAFYLPQFYPTPENDRWWGPGFTEWSNVVAARPLFQGHHQPQLPTTLGFTDLRVPQVRERQAALARVHGIEGFLYWHYWFHGRRLLDRPFQEVLEQGTPDLPFALAWANETWSRRWHGTGSPGEVLMEQRHSPGDDIAHALWLARAFADPRYVCVDGRPLFVVYRPWELPDPRRTVETLRERCIREGVPDPYLLGMNGHRPEGDATDLGFDGTLDHQPQLGVVPGPMEPGLKIYDYPSATRRMRERLVGRDVVPVVMVSWDNTPRRGEDGIAFINATPEAFEENLAAAVERVAGRPPERRLVVINAWNEWAEGCHLEPDDRHGRAWLEAVRRVVEGAR
jgi:lipopolysaccharide biosynthesis protein